MIIWLEKELLIAIHDRQVTEHGGTSGIRDETLLESAIARPQQLYAYGDPAPTGADSAKSVHFTARHIGALAPAPAPTLRGTVSRAHLADPAATLAYGLARNHPFVDGNKRTAHVSYRTFLALNGADFSASDEEKYLTMLAVAEGKWTVEQFAAWLRPRIRPHVTDEVHEPKRAYQVTKAKRARKRR